MTKTCYSYLNLLYFFVLSGAELAGGNPGSVKYVKLLGTSKIVHRRHRASGTSLIFVIMCLTS